MNNNTLGSKGLAQLAGFKLLTLSMIALSFVPPFSFAYITLGILGVAACVKSIQCVRTNNPDLKYFAAFSFIAFVFLSCAVLL